MVAMREEAQVGLHDLASVTADVSAFSFAEAFGIAAGRWPGSLQATISLKQALDIIHSIIDEAEGTNNASQSSTRAWLPFCQELAESSVLLSQACTGEQPPTQAYEVSPTLHLPQPQSSA